MILILFSIDSDRCRPKFQCGKFVLRGGEIPRALSMLSIYLLLNFRNLPRAISKLSSQGPNWQLRAVVLLMAIVLLGWENRRK